MGPQELLCFQHWQIFLVFFFYNPALFSNLEGHLHSLMGLGLIIACALPWILLRRVHLQLIIFESFLIKQISVFWNCLCHCLVPLKLLWTVQGVFFFHSLFFVHSESGTYPFWKIKKFLEAQAQDSVLPIHYFTRPSMPLVKALEVASFWHWAWWCVLGGACLYCMILFQLSFFGEIQSC